jgi:hypothetical protein
MWRFQVEVQNSSFSHENEHKLSAYEYRSEISNATKKLERK